MKAIFDILNVGGDDVLPKQQVAAINAVRREIHASNALQGLIARGGDITLQEADRIGRDWPAKLASAAVRAADALMAELDKPQA